MPRMLLSVTEAGHLLGVSRAKVYELMAAGRLESVKLDRSRKVPLDALERFVQGLREDQRAKVPA